jgi:hypothetical protein
MDEGRQKTTRLQNHLESLRPLTHASKPSVELPFALLHSGAGVEESTVSVCSDSHSCEEVKLPLVIFHFGAGANRIAVTSDSDAGVDPTADTALSDSHSVAIVELPIGMKKVRPGDRIPNKIIYFLTDPFFSPKISADTARRAPDPASSETRLPAVD